MNSVPVSAASASSFKESFASPFHVKIAFFPPVSLLMWSSVVVAEASCRIYVRV